MSQLRLTSPHLPDLPAWHLSVDGMSPAGPNLSHWPGNRTPERFKADLSTGICLNFAKAGRAAQAEFLAGAEAVLNDHYDTDGFLSLLAVLRPEVALAREDLLLAAAATGDYQSFQGEAAFAVDRIVANLAAPESPVAGEFEGLTGTAKDFARYRWLLDNAEAVLDEPFGFPSLFAAELAQIQTQLADPTIECVRHQDVGLALIRSPSPVHRMVLNTKAEDCYRVLHSERTHAGPLYRFHDRTESWFEVQTFQPAPRLALAPLCDALQELESATERADRSARAARAARSARPDRPDGPHPGRWSHDPAPEPVPELYHGVPGSQAYGQITRERTPSTLAIDVVETRFTGFFAAAIAAPPS